MEIFTNSVPTWVSVLFLISIVIAVFMIANAARQGAINANFETSKTNSIYYGILGFYAAYFAYVMLMGFTGIFQENTLPPKIVLLTTLPLLLFLMLFVFRTKMCRTILENVKLSSLVRLHIFRLIGVFFLLTWYYGAIPKYFAFVGGFGDIFAAVTAIFVAKLIDNQHKNRKIITLVWNIIGFCDIVNVLLTAIYLTKKSIETGSQGVVEIANFPFSLIPAFAPATIIFLHICIFKKLKMNNV